MAILRFTLVIKIREPVKVAVGYQEIPVARFTLEPEPLRQFDSYDLSPVTAFAR
jgi:hypothetical protein